MDISKIDLQAEADEAQACHLYDPRTRELLYDGEEPVQVMVLGANSSKARQLHAKLARKNAVNQKPKKDVDIEKVLAEGAEFVAGLTVGWNALEFNGESQFSEQLAAEMYRERPWIMNQVQEFIAEPGNFMQGS